MTVHGCYDGAPGDPPTVRARLEMVPVDRAAAGARRRVLDLRASSVHSTSTNGLTMLSAEGWTSPPQSTRVEDVDPAPVDC